MLHWEGSMKTSPKWPVNRSQYVPLQISLYQHFFFQTAVSRKRNKILEMRWCQNSRIVEGVHPLFRESDLVPLFHPLSATFLKESTFLGCSRWAKLGHFGPKHAPGTLFDGPKKILSGEAQLNVSPDKVWPLICRNGAKTTKICIKVQNYA